MPKSLGTGADFFIFRVDISLQAVNHDAEDIRSYGCCPTVADPNSAEKLAPSQDKDLSSEHQLKNY